MSKEIGKHPYGRVETNVPLFDTGLSKFKMRDLKESHTFS